MIKIQNMMFFFEHQAFFFLILALHLLTMSLMNQMSHIIIQNQFQLLSFLHNCLILVCSCLLYNISIKILQKVIDLFFFSREENFFFFQ